MTVPNAATRMTAITTAIQKLNFMPSMPPAKVAPK